MILTFTTLTLLMLFTISLGLYNWEIFPALVLTVTTALAASLIFIIFAIHFIIFSALILLITQGVIENTDIATGIVVVLSIIATAIYTSIGLKQLNGN